MSGPQHYKEAEQLLSEAHYERTEADRARKVQEAAAHATLALVVATLQSGGLGDKQLHEWRVHGAKV